MTSQPSWYLIHHSAPPYHTPSRTIRPHTTPNHCTSPACTRASPEAHHFPPYSLVHNFACTKAIIAIGQVINDFKRSLPRRPCLSKVAHLSRTSTAGLLTIEKRPFCWQCSPAKYSQGLRQMASLQARDTCLRPGASHTLNTKCSKYYMVRKLFIIWTMQCKCVLYIITLLVADMVAWITWTNMEVESEMERLWALVLFQVARGFSHTLTTKLRQLSYLRDVHCSSSGWYYGNFC